jgi:hypothetical protein
LGIARNTVKKHLQLIDSKGLSYNELFGKSDEELETLFAGPDQKSDQRHQEIDSFLPYMESGLKRPGEVTDLEVYLATLGASQYSYVDALHHKERKTS